MNELKRAKQDLRYKMRLEEVLRSELKLLFSRFVADFYDSLSLDPRVSFEQLWVERLKDLLLTHYKRCSAVFAKNLERQLDIVATEEQKDAIDTNLALFFALEASMTASELLKTTEKNADRAIQLADLERVDHEEETGSQMAKVTYAAIAANLFRQRLKSRLKTVTTTETQKAAEVSKLVEVEVITNGTTTINSPGSSMRLSGKKDWFAVLDNKTRKDHVEADHTQHDVPVNKPFIVGGYKMMYPGDRSLGAPIKQWINCRCICIYSPNK